MKAAIINVGTELTSGDTLNINSQTLSKELFDLGIEVKFHISVEDDKQVLKKISEESIEKVNILIFTGGLGPTDDDFTKEIVSEILGKKLVYDDKIMKSINKFFEERGIKPSENNRKQAYIIEDSYILYNDWGTAPGYLIENANKKIVLLPGPPVEMKNMFLKKVVPHLKSDEIIYKKTIKTIGIGESSLEFGIKDLIRKDNNVNLATYSNLGEVRIKLTSKREESLEEVTNEIINRYKDYIYAFENISIQKAVFESLKKHNIKVSFAESCTGGLVASTLASMEGASEVFEKSYVTYSNTSKREELHVKEDTLNRFGAVSENVAKEMAEGLFLKEDIDIALSITGIAGPEGTEEKPVGLVFIGLKTEGSINVYKYNFVGKRKTIQERTMKEAFNIIRKYLVTKNKYIYIK